MSMTISMSTKPHRPAGLTSMDLMGLHDLPCGKLAPPDLALPHARRRVFGPSAGWHHRVNVLYHLLNTELLFLVLWRMTGGMWQSAFVAALFGVHPLHVESVAWVAERKDVLSTLFWILAMGAYLQYVRRPGIGDTFW